MTNEIIYYEELDGAWFAYATKWVDRDAPGLIWVVVLHVRLNGSLVQVLMRDEASLEYLALTPENCYHDRMMPVMPDGTVRDLRGES
jgi:hypothetical protein